MSSLDSDAAASTVDEIIIKFANFFRDSIKWGHLGVALGFRVETLEANLKQNPVCRGGGGEEERLVALLEFAKIELGTPKFYQRLSRAMSYLDAYGIYAGDFLSTLEPNAQHALEEEGSHWSWDVLSDRAYAELFTMSRCFKDPNAYFIFQAAFLELQPHLYAEGDDWYFMTPCPTPGRIGTQNQRHVFELFDRLLKKYGSQQARKELFRVMDVAGIAREYAAAVMTMDLSSLMNEEVVKLGHDARQTRKRKLRKVGDGIRKKKLKKSINLLA